MSFCVFVSRVESRRLFLALFRHFGASTRIEYFSCFTSHNLVVVATSFFSVRYRCVVHRFMLALKSFKSGTKWIFLQRISYGGAKKRQISSFDFAFSVHLSWLFRPLRHNFIDRFEDPAFPRRQNFFALILISIETQLLIVKIVVRQSSETESERNEWKRGFERKGTEFSFVYLLVLAKK